MPPKVISGGDNPYDIHDAKLSSSATAHESSSVTAHEISNMWKPEVVFFEEEKRIHTGRALSGGCHNWCTRSGIYSDLQ